MAAPRIVPSPDIKHTPPFNSIAVPQVFELLGGTHHWEVSFSKQSHPSAGLLQFSDGKLGISSDPMVWCLKNTAAPERVVSHALLGLQPAEMEVGFMQSFKTLNINRRPGSNMSYSLNSLEGGI